MALNKFENVDADFEFNFIDIINIKAISRKKTPIWKVMRYWDAFNRSYPTYLEFINSINKLTQIGVIQINENGRFSKLSNWILNKMTISERFRFFVNPTEELILNTLSKYNTKTSNEILEINQEEYNEIISEYHLYANRSI